MRHFAVSVSHWSAAVFLSGAVLATAAAPSQVATFEAAVLLDAYDRGDYAAVAQQLTASDARVLDRLDSDLGKRAKEWIAAASSPQKRRRAFVAGAVALELTQALVRGQTWLADRRSEPQNS